MEKSETYYDILGVDSKAETDELKRAYFFLAKNFHPDRYHSEGGDLLKRIQNAFTELAQAHETLKNADSREVYDYRMRKEIAERERRQESGETDAPDIRIQQAADEFGHHSRHSSPILGVCAITTPPHRAVNGYRLIRLYDCRGTLTNWVRFVSIDLGSAHAL